MSVNWNRRSYTKKQFRDAWTGSRSIAECARKLGLSVFGNTYPSLREAASSLDLDETHMVGQGWSKGSTKGADLDTLETHLKPDTRVPSGLKRRLLETGLLENKCSAPFCPVPNPSVHPFTGETTELKMALDHIDGDNRNNTLTNLRLLCYHCHGETETWCGKNRKKTVKAYNTETELRCTCGGPKASKSLHCRPCSDKVRVRRLKIDWPEDKHLIESIRSNGYARTAAHLGVSDSAIRGRLVRKGIDPKTLT